MAKRNTKKSDDSNVDDVLGLGADSGSATAVADPPKKGRAKKKVTKKEEPKQEEFGYDETEEEVAEEEESAAAEGWPKFVTADSAEHHAVLVEIASLTIDPQFPRPVDPEAVNSLVKQIRAVGKLINPVHVDEEGNVLAGRHRVAAFEKMGRKEIPAFIYDGDPDKYDESAFALVEQLSSRQLTPLETAASMKDLLERKVFPDQKSLAKFIGMSAPRVSQLLSIVEAPQRLRDAIEEGTITPTAAVALNKLEPDALETQLEAIKEAGAGKLTVKKAEQIVSKLAHEKPETIKTKKTKSGKKGKKPGRQPGKQSQNFDEGIMPAGVSGRVRVPRESDEQPDAKYIIEFTFTMATARKSLTKSQFDVASKLQILLDDLSESSIQDELEAARKVLDA